LKRFSKKINFPLDNIFVIDGSKRSNKANAFFSGIGRKKKIVLYDTLIANHSTDELVAVLAHEVGALQEKAHYLGLFSFGNPGCLYTVHLIPADSKFNCFVGDGRKSGSYSFKPASIWEYSFHLSPVFIGLFMSMYSRKNEFEGRCVCKGKFQWYSLSPMP
jgi:STE24 endopeptidase